MSLTNIDTRNLTTAQGSASARFHQKSSACKKPNPKSASRTASKSSCFNEKKSISKRLRTLQRLIPGGRNMEAPEVLFHETADYILKLRRQVQFLEFLTNLYSKPGDHSLTVESCGSSGIDDLWLRCVTICFCKLAPGQCSTERLLKPCADWGAVWIFCGLLLCRLQKLFGSWVLCVLMDVWIRHYVYIHHAEIGGI